MPRYRLSLTEILILVLVLLMLATGFYLFYTNLTLFSRYVVEDGLVEWLTVLGLILGCGVSISRFFRLLGKRSWWFLAVTLAIAFVLFFGAGEEISWGQRILGIKSSEFFARNNAQHETNFHNLVVDGVKLNKLIFSLLLSIAMGIYLIIVPIVYEKSQAIRRFLDHSAVPVPRLYQVIAFILLFIITALLHHEKNAELLECGTALLLFLVVRFPKNIQIYRSQALTSL